MNTGFAVVRASCKPIERRLFLLFFAVFLGFASLVAATGTTDSDARSRGLMMAFILAFPVFVFWGGWASRMLVLLLHARNLRIPGLPGEVRNALLAMVAVTVVLPAIGCIAYGGQPSIMFAVPLLAAGSGMLFALLPRGLAPLVGFGPLALSQLGRLRPESLSWSLLLPAIAIILLLFLAWRVRELIRHSPTDEKTGWNQPMLLATAERGSFWVGRDLFDARVQGPSLPGWASRAASVDGLGPRAPVRSLRTLLGGGFSPMQGRQRLVLMVGWAVGLSFIWFYAGRTVGARGDVMLLASLLGGAALSLVPLATQLQALQRDHAGELCEAALLPGWSRTTTAHALMLQATLRVYVVWVAGFVAWMLGVTLYFDRIPAVLPVMLATAGIAALGLAVWMRPLSGKPWVPGPWSAVAAIFTGAMLLGVTLVAILADHFIVNAMWAWLATIVCAGISTGRSLRRYNARPHPFLME